LPHSAFGNIADLNLGNFLLRMPGVSKEESEGEIIRVQIRGVDSNLSAVSVDGTRASNGSTRSFDRGFEIDKVPTDFIETIEITKAPTPDIDADSIGGAVNLRTKSALDRKGRRTTYQIGNSYNVRKETFRPLGSVSFSDILLDQKLGVLATASYNEAHKPRDSSNVDWERTTDTTRPAAFTASSWGEDQLKHKRAGFGLRFDYRLTPTTKVYVNGMYSLYEDQLNRRRGSLSTPPSASNVVPGSVTDRVTETRNQMFSFTQNFRDRDVKTWNYQVGGDSTIWGGTLDFSANYSPSRGAEQRFVPTRRVANTGWRQEFTESRNWLVLRQTSGPDIYDWRNSTTVLETRDNTSRDLITGGQVNFRRTLGTEIPLSIKTGGRYRWQKREQDQNRRNYTYVGPDGVAGPAGPDNDDRIDRFFDPGYTYVPFQYPQGLQFLKLPEFRQEMQTAPQHFLEDLAVSTRESIRFDNKATESVAAAYFMGDVRLGRLTTLAGVRMEETRFTGKAFKQEITPEERARRAAFTGPLTPEETIRRTIAEWSNRTSASGNYRDYFPSIHFKYEITRGSLVRLQPHGDQLDLFGAGHGGADVHQRARQPDVAARDFKPPRHAVDELLHDGLNLPPQDAGIRSGHPDVAHEGRALRQNARIRRGHVRMRAQHRGHAAIEVPAERLFLGRGLRVKFDDNRVGLGTQLLDHPVCSLEGTIRLHRHVGPAQQRKHRHAEAAGFDDDVVPPGTLSRQVGRTAHAVHLCDFVFPSPLVPDVVAEGDRIDATFEQ
jgi:TonB-dependent receptor